MAVLERIPVGRISAEAREIRFGPALLTLVAGVLFALGWLAAKVCRAMWAVVAWTFAAVRVGWQEGMARREAVPDGRG
ncbi:hypothetical protein QMZ92_16385 [Streptomyces sp. HNM0645]|uniref:hypothetical protein n=1 Tax=Streptomyces sp. HNM0645 TaxID=2782343 RepID=UPI0024B85C6E|nr:hypothetical protein [Streptomyces sp. HNM0645]MDI9885913.1 hypothetical protein [Streptomyces sp. HNM0645]